MRKWLWAIPVGLLVVFFLATGVKVLAAGGTAELAKILEAGLNGLVAYFNWLLEVLKIVW
jgi:hypothetical protein